MTRKMRGLGVKRKMRKPRKDPFKPRDPFKKGDRKYLNQYLRDGGKR